jgi:hypothetical protein
VDTSPTAAAGWRRRIFASDDGGAAFTTMLDLTTAE